MPHIHHKYDFTVSAFIVHEDKILLQHHKKQNKWMQVGGHVDLDQTPDEALMTEISEECGLEVAVLADKAPCADTEAVTALWRPDFVNVHVVKGDHHHIDLGYVCRAITTDAVLEERAAYAIGWYTLDEAKELDTAPNVIELYTAALEIASEAR